MYVVIAGGGKVGWNLARELIEKHHEVTLIEQDRRRYLIIEEELEHAVQYGDSTELWILERAGIQRADLVIAVTGDDEDNILICQIAKEKYLCERTISRVNNPRNMQHFELLGIQPAVSATDLILRLIEHDRPMRSHQLLRALSLEHAEFVRRLGFLVVVGLIRIERALPLSDRDQRIVLTGNGTLRVVAERAATRTLPAPGVRSRLSSRASTLEGTGVAPSSSQSAET